MLSEPNSQLTLLKLKDTSSINSVVFSNIFNDVLDLCGYEGVKQINVQLSAAKRDILRGLYEYYKREHKYRGVI